MVYSFPVTPNAYAGILTGISFIVPDGQKEKQMKMRFTESVQRAMFVVECLWMKHGYSAISKDGHFTDLPKTNWAIEFFAEIEATPIKVSNRLSAAESNWAKSKIARSVSVSYSGTKIAIIDLTGVRTHCGDRAHVDHWEVAKISYRRFFNRGTSYIEPKTMGSDWIEFECQTRITDGIMDGIAKKAA